LIVATGKAIKKREKWQGCTGKSGGKLPHFRNIAVLPDAYITK